MQNVHSLNQDDVLSGEPRDDELSPSAFGDEGEEAGAVKKGGSKLVLFGGIGVAVLMVVFFAWKIFSPHFQSAQQQQPEGFDTLAAAPQHAAAPGPGAPQLLDPAAQPAATPAPAVQEQAPAPAASAPRAGPAAPGVAGPAAQPAQPAQLAQPAQPIQAIQPPVQQPVAAAAPAAPTAIQSSPAAAPASPTHAPDGLAQVNARIDNLERSIAAIQDMVNKMAANANNAKPAATAGRAPASAPPATAPAVKASRTVSRSGGDRAGVKKAAASAVELAPAVSKSEPRDEKPVPKTEGGARATLKAVLDGRAWFQTKSGDTLTVSVGEEVPGLGVVKSIDTDLGEVRFANGLSVR